MRLIPLLHVDESHKRHWLSQQNINDSFFEASIQLDRSWHLKYLLPPSESYIGSKIYHIEINFRTLWYTFE